MLLLLPVIIGYNWVLSMRWPLCSNTGVYFLTVLCQGKQTMCPSFGMGDLFPCHRFLMRLVASLNYKLCRWVYLFHHGTLVCFVMLSQRMKEKCGILFLGLYSPISTLKAFWLRLYQEKICGAFQNWSMLLSFKTGMLSANLIYVILLLVVYLIVRNKLIEYDISM